MVPSVICLPTAESSFSFLLTDKPTTIVVDPSPAVEVEEPDAEDPPTKRMFSCSFSYQIESMVLSTSTTDSLSIIRDFVQRTGIYVQFAVTEDEIRR